MTNQHIVIGVKGVILHNGKALIVKRAEKSHFGGGTWECVGGKLEFGEDLVEALVRETKEEVGLDIRVKRILYASTFKTDPSRQVVIVTYLCFGDENNVVLSEEHSDYLWATKEQLRKLLPSSILDNFENHNVFELEGLLE